MNAKTLRIERNKNLGNYETLRISLEVDLGTAPLADAVRDTQRIIDWYLNKPARDEMHERLNAERESADEPRRAAIDRWLAHYNEERLAVESIEAGLMPVAV